MPWTSAVCAASSIEITPLSPDTSSPGVSVAERGRKRLEVFFARRTGWPAGIASYDALRRATAVSWAASPVSTDRNLLRGQPSQRSEVLVAQAQGGGRGVLFQMPEVAGARDGQDVRSEREV